MVSGTRGRDVGDVIMGAERREGKSGHCGKLGHVFAVWFSVI